MINSKLYVVSNNRLLLELFYESKTAKTSFYFELRYRLSKNKIIITGIKPVKNVLFYLYDHSGNVKLQQPMLKDEVKDIILKQIFEMYFKDDKVLNNFKDPDLNALAKEYLSGEDNRYDDNKKLLRTYMNGQKHNEK